MSKYGIFKATICVERPPLKMLDIIENDYYIGKPLEVFDTAEQAVSKMNEEYFSSIKKVHQYPRSLLRLHHLLCERVRIYLW